MQGEIKQKRADLKRDRQAFEDEKLSVWQQFMVEKQREWTRSGTIADAPRRRPPTTSGASRPRSRSTAGESTRRGAAWTRRVPCAAGR
jgi:hypothetical protein